jgi:hypothetical protein
MKERKNSKPKPLSQLIAPEFDISAVTSNARQTFNRQQEQMEPLTLREEQLQEAREAAADILQNKQPDEALTIFTEGLVPVRSVREMECLKQTEALQYRNLRARMHSCRSLPSAAAAPGENQNNDDLSPSPHPPGSVRSAPF